MNVHVIVSIYVFQIWLYNKCYNILSICLVCDCVCGWVWSVCMKVSDRVFMVSEWKATMKIYSTYNCIINCDTFIKSTCYYPNKRDEKSVIQQNLTPWNLNDYFCSRLDIDMLKSSNLKLWSINTMLMKITSTLSSWF